ncbi:hypothetical protein Btru_066171 [Bulinus truncatus]|nr:hypothetical protein Btru_066171 [Bulinus truncatus]
MNFFDLRSQRRFLVMAVLLNFLTDCDSTVSSCFAMSVVSFDFMFPGTTTKQKVEQWEVYATGTGYGYNHFSQYRANGHQAPPCELNGANRLQDSDPHDDRAVTKVVRVECTRGDCRVPPPSNKAFSLGWIEVGWGQNDALVVNGGGGCYSGCRVDSGQWNCYPYRSLSGTVTHTDLSVELLPYTDIPVELLPIQISQWNCYPYSSFSGTRYPYRSLSGTVTHTDLPVELLPIQISQWNCYPYRSLSGTTHTVRDI